MKAREQRIERMRAVRSEYETATVAIAALGERLRADPSALDEFGLAQRDFRVLRQNVEATYLVRLFAEFETGLRSAWTGAFRRQSHPRAADLVNGIAAMRSIPQKWLDAVHDVRRYRNSIVHEESLQVAEIRIQDASDQLFRFKYAVWIAEIVVGLRLGRRPEPEKPSLNFGRISPRCPMRRIATPPRPPDPLERYEMGKSIVFLRLLQICTHPKRIENRSKPTAH